MHDKNKTTIFNDKKGFTFVELLLVLSIIGIVAAVCISAVSTNPDKVF